MQMNAGTVIHSDEAIKVIHDGYIHILSTDTHNMDKRPPRLLEAMEELDKDTRNALIRNADAVFNNRPVEEISKKSSSFFGSLFRK